MRHLPLLILLCAPLAARGGDPVVVLLRDGRTPSGELDTATDASRLWINVSQEGFALRSGFEWSAVQAVVHDSRQLSPGEFRKVLGEFIASKPEMMDQNPLPAIVMKKMVMDGEGDDIVPVALTRPAPPPVRSLRVRAWAASWDGDPEHDGLLVEVVPLGPSGEFVPVAGQLDMTLVGEHSRGHPERLRRFRPRYPEIARQSTRVAFEDFWTGPAVYRLPYRHLIPDEHLDLFPQGVLTATLGIPGQGNFTASTDALSLVPASPIRDRRQQWSGRRDFAQERSHLRSGRGQFQQWE